MIEEAVLRAWPSNSGREGGWGRTEARGCPGREGPALGCDGSPRGRVRDRLGESGWWCESGGKVWTSACTLRETVAKVRLLLPAACSILSVQGGGCCYDYPCFIEKSKLRLREVKALA